MARKTWRGNAAPKAVINRVQPKSLDAVLLTHPNNRRFNLAIEQATERIAKRYRLKAVAIAYDERCEERRTTQDGRDDGAQFVLMMEGVRLTMKLFGPQGDVL